MFFFSFFENLLNFNCVCVLLFFKHISPYFCCNSGRPCCSALEKMTTRVFRIYVMTSMFVDATRNALIFFFQICISHIMIMVIMRLTLTFRSQLHIHML